MKSFTKTVTWDCEDALRLASFWAAVLGSDVDEDSTPGRAFVEASGWGGPNMWLNRVPEPKSAKNRLHFDLRPLGTSVAERLEDHVIMRDPEGNEFCVEPGMQT